MNKFTIFYTKKIIINSSNNIMGQWIEDPSPHVQRFTKRSHVPFSWSSSSGANHQKSQSP